MKVIAASIFSDANKHDLFLFLCQVQIQLVIDYCSPLTQMDPEHPHEVGHICSPHPHGAISCALVC